MANQFDLEQGIMSCWGVTDELNLLLEELMENQAFTQDQAANFVLGLAAIYDSKFEKLNRTFEDFLKQYYKMSNELKQARIELHDMHYELEAIENANEELSLAEIFDEEELKLEDEFGFR